MVVILIRSAHGASHFFGGFDLAQLHISERFQPFEIGYLQFFNLNHFAAHNNMTLENCVCLDEKDGKKLTIKMGKN